jgi:hypothetical protein
MILLMFMSELADPAGRVPLRSWAEAFQKFLAVRSVSIAVMETRLDHDVDACQPRKSLTGWKVLVHGFRVGCGPPPEKLSSAKLRSPGFNPSFPAFFQTLGPDLRRW